MDEIWKPIKGYEGLYEVSNLGRVKRLPYKTVGRTIGRRKEFIRHSNGGVLKGTICKNGYWRVTLTKNAKNRYYHIHRLVATAFIPNPNNFPFINHRDQIRTNNLVDNLEWCTCKYNNSYGDAIERARVTRNAKNDYPVKMLSKTGEYIKTFPSIRDAAKEFGVAWETIRRAIRKERKTACGYVWEECR